MNTSYYCYLQSPIGQLTLSSDGSNITGLWMDGQKYYAQTLEGEASNKRGLEIFDKAEEWLANYFAGNNPDIYLPLAPFGSEFRQQVWAALCKIPYGTVTTYGNIAKQLALANGQSKVSARAVGNAVGHNPISILIPCHRVIGSNGKLTGYAGGIEKKEFLLRLEGQK